MHSKSYVFICNRWSVCWDRCGLFRQDSGRDWPVPKPHAPASINKQLKPSLIVCESTLLVCYSYLAIVQWCGVEIMKRLLLNWSSMGIYCCARKRLVLGHQNFAGSLSLTISSTRSSTDEHELIASFQPPATCWKITQQVNMHDTPCSLKKCTESQAVHGQIARVYDKWYAWLHT